MKRTLSFHVRVAACVALIGPAHSADAQASARPVPPGISPPAALNASICTSGTKSEVDAAVEEQGGLIKAADRASEAYNKALTDWKAERLVETGVWTKAKKVTFFGKLLADPVLVAGQRAKLSEVQKMLAAANLVTAAEKAGDRAGACASTLEMLLAVGAMAARNVSDWQYTHRLIDEVAKQGGVSFR